MKAKVICEVMFEVERDFENDEQATLANCELEGFNDELDELANTYFSDKTISVFSNEKEIVYFGAGKETL